MFKSNEVIGELGHVTGHKSALSTPSKKGLGGWHYMVHKISLKFYYLRGFFSKMITQMFSLKLLNLFS